MMVELMKPTPEDTLIDPIICSADFFLITTSLISYSDYTYMSVSFSIIIFVKRWMKLTLSFANLTNKETFVSLMKKGYKDNAQVIQATDDAHGSGTSKKLAHLLEKYHEELITND